MRKMASVVGLWAMALLLSGPAFAEGHMPGDSCQAEEVGTTLLSGDNVNIIACLKKAPGSSAYVYKNYMPDNRIESGNVQTCQEGNIAVYKDGRFVCKNEGVCNDGDIVLFKQGRFLCEKKAGILTMKNYIKRSMPRHAISGGTASDYNTGMKLYSDTIALGGRQLDSFTYTAKSTGRAKVLVSVPFRYYQDSDWQYFRDGTNPIGHVFEEAILAGLSVVDSHGTVVVSTEGEISNPHAGESASSGDIGHVMVTMPVVAGQTYTITIKLRTYGATYNRLCNEYYWAGSMEVADHFTDGYTEITEYGVP